jgi:hypothetical protein
VRVVILLTLAAGASQTGFGRTGTVDWDTTPKTATVTVQYQVVGYFLIQVVVFLQLTYQQELLER